jgi:phosphatidate cytidylyltransferase
VSFGLLPIGLILVAIGGWPFALAITLVLCLAATEYATMARAGGIQASLHLLVGGVALLALARHLLGLNGADWQITLLTLAAMAYHLVLYERGRDHAGTDFAATLAGILYIGWLGAYFISLVNLPEGRFWLLTVLPAVWAADSGAYIVGKRIGRHKMTPRLSPKKSWEGLLGGVVFSVVITALLAYGWQQLIGPDSAITPLRGVILGVVLSILPVLGDLGESMLKRQVGMKDSGNLLPGHGGVFDRIDSWLWAAPIGYYVIVWFFLA